MWRGDERGEVNVCRGGVSWLSREGVRLIGDGGVKDKIWCCVASGLDGLCSIIEVTES